MEKAKQALIFAIGGVFFYFEFLAWLRSIKHEIHVKLLRRHITAPAFDLAATKVNCTVVVLSASTNWLLELDGSTVWP